MGKRLYVGNLPFSTTEDDLRQAFSAHGNIESVRIITDKFSGRSKGFAFVEMSTEEEAQKAINDLNGKDMGGRNVVVSEAKPEEARAPRGFGGGGGGGGGGGRGDFGGGRGGGRGGFGGGGGRGDFGGGGGGGGGRGGRGGGGGRRFGDDDNFGNR